MITQKCKAIKRDIQRLFSDTTVSADQTAEDIEELKVICEDYLSALELDKQRDESHG